MGRGLRLEACGARSVSQGRLIQEGIMRGIVVLAAALVLLSTGAAAAPKRKSAPVGDGPMHVHVVRSAHPDCEPECPQWIAAQGRHPGCLLQAWPMREGRDQNGAFSTARQAVKAQIDLRARFVRGEC